MPSKLGRWSPTLKLSALILILFFVISNFSFLWLSYRAKNALREEIKAKLEASSSQLAQLVVRADTPSQARETVQKFLAEEGLLAFGFFETGPLPVIWPNSRTDIPFAADFQPVQQATLAGPIAFGGHFTCTFSFPASNRKEQKRPAGFVVASVESLGQLERLFFLQTYIWVIGFFLMALTASLLWRFVLAPFEAVEKKAAEARLTPTGSGPDADPAAVTIESFERAIGALKAKEQELSRLYQESQKKALHYSTLSKHLIESLNSGIIIFDSKGKIIDANPAAKEFLEPETEPYLPAALEKILAEAQTGGPAESMELELETAHKRKIVAASASVICNPEGESLGKALLLSDLTGFKEMEKKLKEKEHWAFLGETAAGLAHELRNALAVMVGYTKLLAKAVGKNHPSHKTAGELLKESRAAEETLKRFLDYTRPGQAFIEPVDLRALVEETILSLKSRFPGVCFRLNAPQKIPGLSDAGLLKQIFSNLLRNGAEAAGPEGWVEVKIESQKAFLGWQITIADSGPGVPEKAREQIFSPFFTTKPEGTGLGLALVKKAVHLLEGEIRLESGKNGCLFILNLPEKLRRLPQKNQVQKEHHIR